VTILISIALKISKVTKEVRWKALFPEIEPSKYGMCGDQFFTCVAFLMVSSYIYINGPIPPKGFKNNYNHR
jgi:hypothetical protein